MFGIADVEAARGRIADATRRTPIWKVDKLKHSPIPDDAALWLKLELLQATGSFKARGAVNKARALSAGELERGIVTASGGNHGLAVAYVGKLLGVPATICLPTNVHPDKVEKLKTWGAKVVIDGARWDLSNRNALAIAATEGLAYIHPFGDPLVAAGQGTIALEILEDAPQIDTLLVAIGGGGLITGIAAAVKAIKPTIRVIGIEPVGAQTLKASLDAGEVVTLPKISTAAVTLAAGRTEPFNFDIIRRHVDEIVLVTDDEMRDAARWLWSELSVAAELSGAASVAALFNGSVKIRRGENVCALVCGAGRDGWA
jgi:threonine dehydratase